MIENYIIIEADSAHELASTVNLRITDGYDILGVLVVTNNQHNYYRYTQAMVKHKQPTANVTVSGSEESVITNYKCPKCKRYGFRTSLLSDDMCTSCANRVRGV